MKKISISVVSLFLLLIFIACSKSIYYAYEYEGEGYSTLEVKKHEIIYRSSSPEYWQNQKYLQDYNYIYIYSKDEYKHRNNFKDNMIFMYINITTPIYAHIYIPMNDSRNIPSLSMVYVSPKFSYDLHKSMTYSTQGISRDTIRLVSRDEFKKDSAFIETGLRWFPYEMYRVDKIDYNKFTKGIPYKKLKDPK